MRRGAPGAVSFRRMVTHKRPSFTGVDFEGRVSGGGFGAHRAQNGRSGLEMAGNRATARKGEILAVELAIGEKVCS